jgi:selenocysteine lyase/cysteine desulfurase
MCVYVRSAHRWYIMYVCVCVCASHPAIIESIRCGLVFQLKDAVSARLVETVEHLHVEYLMHRLMKNPAIIIMGNAAAERLSIVSMNITVRGRLLHYNFVVALLNDLFGIQARGGCSCAGPYGMRLFGLSEVRVCV